MDVGEDVHIGIVTWNCADRIGACLDALPDALEGLEFEVVVVDNASTDGSAAAARERSFVSVVELDTNVGYARAMNRALAGSEARALIALNPDTEASPGSLAALVRYLDGHSEVGLVAPRLDRPDGSVEHSVHRFPTLSVAATANLLPMRWLSGTKRDRLWLPGAVRPGRSGTVDWVIGAVHCIRGAAVTGSVPYAEGSFMYVEDLDLCWRLHRDGWEVHFLGEVVVRHEGNVSGRRAFSWRRRARWLTETYRWYGSTFGDLRARAYALLNLLGDLRRAIVADVAGALRGQGKGRLGSRAFRAGCGVHLRTVVRGPSRLPPTGPPPPSGRVAGTDRSEVVR